MTPVQAHELHKIIGQADAAEHGEKTAIYKAGAARLSISYQTLMRWIKRLAPRPARKRRTDAGTTGIPLAELEKISALLVLSIRKNDKQLSSIPLAVQRLRENGEILCGRANEQTGVIRHYSESAITRALYQNILHPEQLLQPDPAVSLRSRHPNDVWQIDASLSTQVYLDPKKGLQALNKAEHYDGKPQNMKKIERLRLCRYAITDHASGTIYVEYVLGAESAENICAVLINAMQKKRNDNPFCGVPFRIMTDPGAAMTSAPFRNLCKNLSIDLIINKPKNARAKGQVEGAHNIIERQFESALKIQPEHILEDINAAAQRWSRYYNATSVHSRTRQSRFAVWQSITAEQLRFPPSVEICRELAVSAPEERTVTTKLQIPFRTFTYDVSSVPGVIVGEKLLITRNPWNDDDSAKVVLVDAEGREIFHEIPRVYKDDYGFDITGPVIGEGYKPHRETPVQKNKKKVQQIITDTDSVEAAEKALKAGALPFGGRIDPHKHIENTPLPAYLPRPGFDLQPTVTVEVQESRLSVFEIAQRLKDRIHGWGKEQYQWLQREYPEGAPESSITEIESRLQRRARLSIVGGNT